MQKDLSYLSKIRNIGVCAHVDAGKTTVTERILFYAGKAHKIGEVHEGSATMDYMVQEQERGITITAAATTIFWSGYKKNLSNHQINIIDTPGHIDFTAEVERSLRVLDGACIVICASSGIEPQTETVWRQATKYQVPSLIFINKMDRVGANFDFVVEAAQKKLTKNAIPINFNIGSQGDFTGVVDIITLKAIYFTGNNGIDVIEEDIPDDLKERAHNMRIELLDELSKRDDILLNRMLEEDAQPLTEQDIHAAIQRCVIKNEFVPILCGSAFKNKGVQMILDAVLRYLPNPQQAKPASGFDRNNNYIQRHVEDALSILAFKIVSDNFMGKMAFLRVYSGEVNPGDVVINTRTGRKSKLGRCVEVHANKRFPKSAIRAGDIVACLGMDIKTGDTLCAPGDENYIMLENISFSNPVISISIEADAKEDQAKLSSAIAKMLDEDPSLKVTQDNNTGETIMSGMGELHLEIICDRMRREEKAKFKTGKPKVAYKETITQPSEASGEFIRQSGGRGQYGHAVIKIQPLPRGSGNKFVNNIVGGVIPREYISAVEKGVNNQLQTGVLSGHPLIDIEIILFDGSYHEVDSSEMAFILAGEAAIRKAVKQAHPIILEPIMSVSTVTPEQYIGDVIGDINRRRGVILDLQQQASHDIKQVNSQTPLSEMFGYATHLRSITQGRGTFVMEFTKYTPVKEDHELYQQKV